MYNEKRTAVGRKVERPAGTSNAMVINDESRRAPARKANRARIEALLDELRDERLTKVWRLVCPLATDPAYDLPARGGIIEDLADFAEVLRPRLDGMKPGRLCRLIEKYATYKPRLSPLPVSMPARPTGALRYSAVAADSFILG